MKEEIEKKYQKDAKDFIDTLFDNGYFHENVKRDDMRKIEELLAYLFQSNVNSAIRAKDMLRKIREISK